MKKLFLMFLLVPCFTLAGEPTKQQTIEFLKEKLNTVTPQSVKPIHLNNKISSTIHHKEYQYFRETSPCVFELEQSMPKMEEINKIYGSLYGHTKRKQVFNAKDLDPDTVEVRQTELRGLGVDVFTTKRQKKVKVISEAFDPKRDKFGCDDSDYHVTFTSPNKCIINEPNDYAVRFGYILSPNKVNAPKVAKAVRHLIKLCGGKSELF